jgi:hypothetical protein
MSLLDRIGSAARVSGGRDRTGALLRAPFPEIGVRVPLVALRATIAVLGAALSLVELQGFWLVVGFILSAGAALAPRFLSAWLLILVLGVSIFWQTPSPENWRFYIVLAGIHLVHVLAAQALSVPVTAWLQLRVLVRPLRRYVVIQVISQALAVLVLVVTAGAHNISLPVLGILGAVALIAIALVLVIPLLREKARGPAD